MRKVFLRALAPGFLPGLLGLLIAAPLSFRNRIAARGSTIPNRR